MFFRRFRLSAGHLKKVLPGFSTAQDSTSSLIAVGLLSLCGLMQDFTEQRIEIGDKPSFVLGLQVSGVLLRKFAEEAQLEPGKTEGILQGSVDLGGDPRESHSTTGAGHFELVSAKLKPMDFLIKLGELLNIDELQLLKLSDAKIDVTIRE